ncbi:serine/arginine repetitive matrix protein 1-like [Amphiura filiformis]|uniref:serine/arginine repetitive matrix protein 1-like n=1 Tax=Amphiura filiformis TaxID=82378 RepID=UPI003B2239FE
MADAGFFRGTSADQDNRFVNKQKKLLKTLKFAPVLEKKVCMSRVNLDTLRPWITTKVTEMLGVEDDVLIEFICNQLDEEENPDPKTMQINLTGFLNAKNAFSFMHQLWDLLTSAQENIAGIPAAFLEQKKEEIKKRQQEQERIQAGLKQQEEESKAKEKDKEDRDDKDRDRKDRRDRDRSRDRDSRSRDHGSRDRGSRGDRGSKHSDEEHDGVNGSGDRKQSTSPKIMARPAKWDWEPHKPAQPDNKDGEDKKDEDGEPKSPGGDKSLHLLQPLMQRRMEIRTARHHHLLDR